MAGTIKIEVEKLPTQFINMKVDVKIFEQFQKKCKQQNIPMNVVIEAFARQYANGRYELSEGDILKWRRVNIEKETVLNTPINKDVYYKFKDVVKSQEYFVRHVLSAFIEDYGKNNMYLEFVKDTE